VWLEEDRGMLCEDANRVGDIPVHFAVLRVGVLLQKGEVVVEVGWNDSVSGCKGLSEAAEGHVLIALGVVVRRVNNQVWCDLSEVTAELVSKGSCQRNDQVRDVAEDELIMVNAIIFLFLFVFIFLVVIAILEVALVLVHHHFRLTECLLLQEANEHRDKFFHAGTNRGWPEGFSYLAESLQNTLDDLFVVLLLKQLEVIWEHRLVQECGHMLR